MTMICNCTLAGTPHCSECLIGKNFETLQAKWHPTITKNLIFSIDMSKQLVDTSKYDVIEKKETKIARLKSELEEETNDHEGLLIGLKNITNLIKETEDNIEKIKQELAELENEEGK